MEQDLRMMASIAELPNVLLHASMPIFGFSRVLTVVSNTQDYWVFELLHCSVPCRTQCFDLFLSSDERMGGTNCVGSIRKS